MFCILKRLQFILEEESRGTEPPHDGKGTTVDRSSDSAS